MLYFSTLMIYRITGLTIQRDQKSEQLKGIGPCTVYHRELDNKNMKLPASK